MSRWRSGHLFDHGDRGLLLTGMVRPTVAALLDEGRIDHFFFLRFDLGGPHVRLRLRACAGAEAGVEKTVEAAAASFFARRPTPRPLSPETLRQRNQVILAEDASEQDDAVHPDTSVLWPGWKPESERYGGPALLPASLDFFAVSSARVLALLAEQTGLPPPAAAPRTAQPPRGSGLGGGRQRGGAGVAADLGPPSPRASAGAVRGPR